MDGAVANQIQEMTDIPISDAPRNTGIGNHIPTDGTILRAMRHLIVSTNRAGRKTMSGISDENRLTGRRRLCGQGEAVLAPTVVAVICTCQFHSPALSATPLCCERNSVKNGRSHGHGCVP